MESQLQNPEFTINPETFHPRIQKTMKSSAQVSGIGSLSLLFRV